MPTSETTTAENGANSTASAAVGDNIDTAKAIFDFGG
jgi:hypothetical protein